MKRLCVVIVNFNTANLTNNCIDSIAFQLDLDQDAIIVVDNNSKENDLSIIQCHIEKKNYSNLVTLIQSEANNGFASGNNLAIKCLCARYYILLNSDTIAYDNLIHELLEASHKFPNAGIVSPRVEDEYSHYQSSCFRFYHPIYEMIKTARTTFIAKILNKYDIDLGNIQGVYFPDWVSFACVLIKSEVFTTIGLLDESYFMYFEDVDFCRRSQNAKFGIVYWPEAKVIHFCGKSSSFDSKIKNKKRLPSYFYKSRSLYYRKHFGIFGFIKCNIFWYLGMAISITKNLFLMRKLKYIEKQWLDIWIK